MAGTLIWSIIGITTLFSNDCLTVRALFTGTGSTVFTGNTNQNEPVNAILTKSKSKNVFDNLFLFSILQVLPAY